MIALQTAPAVAEGTTAGTTITNEVTVDYRVGGVDQTDLVATNELVVDRKVSFLVTRVPDQTTTVTPGQSNAVITYDITNLSNETIDLALAVVQASGDDFDVNNIAIYLDDGNGVFDGTETLVTYLDEIAEDQVRRVMVVGNVALSQNNGQVANLVLSATASEGGAAGAQGALITSTAGGNTNQKDTVLADGAGPSDSARDGVFSAAGSYTVFAATLAITKTSRVISDPLNNSTNPKAIPGATIEYCVVVNNAAGSATATNVTITDPLPGDLTYDATFGVRINGSSDGAGNCDDDGSPDGNFSAGSVTATLENIPGGEERTLYFRATIN
jgi:uncharacterized repeat protein (TIGR01451 family)